MGYHCAENPEDTEDGYVPGAGANHACSPYDTDYNPADFVIDLPELLRIIQFYNSLGYHYCPDDETEDGFCPGLARPRRNRPLLALVFAGDFTAVLWAVRTFSTKASCGTPQD